MVLQRVIFWSVAVLLCSQVGGWISHSIRSSRQLQDARIAALRAGRAEAWQYDYAIILRYMGQQRELPAPPGVIEGRDAEIPALDLRKAMIEQRFPHVAVVPTPVEPDDPPLLDSRGYLALRTEPLAEMERERARAVWRDAGQGAFMALGVLLGLTYIYRRLNAGTELMLRQRNFIASVTHELKTPIAALRVWIETLFAHQLDEPRKARIQELMDKDLHRLTDLVQNLLTAAQADAGSLELVLAPLELGPWLRQVCESMDQRLGPGSLGLRREVAPAIAVMADPKLLTIPVENLLSNAFKYAAEPRTTTVTLDGDAEDAILVVADQGQGFPAKESHRIFQRFYRVGNEMTRQVPGTGLGLFLAREIVERHGGTIVASSRGRGLGAAFTIRLPRLGQAHGEDLP
jgi:signal transduction histidine kinase